MKPHQVAARLHNILAHCREQQEAHEESKWAAAQAGDLTCATYHLGRWHWYEDRRRSALLALTKMET